MQNGSQSPPLKNCVFSVISSSYKNPPCPPLEKGGKKTWFSRVTLIMKHTTNVPWVMT